MVVCAGGEVGGVDLHVPLPFAGRIHLGVLIVGVGDAHNLGQRVGQAAEVLGDHHRAELGAVGVLTMPMPMSRYAFCEETFAWSRLRRWPSSDTPQSSRKACIASSTEVAVGVGILAGRAGTRVAGLLACADRASRPVGAGVRLELVVGHVLAVRLGGGGQVGVPGQRRLGRAAGDGLFGRGQVDVVVGEGCLDVGLRLLVTLRRPPEGSSGPG